MKAQNILFFLFLSEIYLTFAANKYNLKIKNGIDGSDNIVLIPGIFTKITLELSSENGDDFTYEKDEDKKASYKVTFNNDNIVVYHEEMILTPQDSLVYTNYIGISCQDIDEDSFSLSINAEPYKNADDRSINYDKEVKIKISKIKAEIKLDLLLRSMAQLSKNFFTLEKELYNVDEIKISVDDKLSALTKFTFKDILITSFKDRLEEEISKDSPANHGILFNSEFFPTINLDAAKFKFNLNLDAKTTGLCFKLAKSDFEFELKADDYIKIDSKTKAAIIYNTENQTPKFDVSNIIKINTEIPIFPVILDCQFSLDSDFSIDDKTSLSSTIKENVFKTIITSKGKFDITMKNLNVSAEYYAKCNISTTAIDKYISTINITIGNFNTSDIIRQLIPSKDPNATPQCAKFTFQNELQSGIFFGLAPFYCNYFMKKTDSIIARAIPSIICQSMPIAGKTSTLCVSPSPLYNTAKLISNKKETDFNKRFDDFINDVKQLDISKYSLGLIKLEIKNVEREYDISINPSSISVSYIKTNKLNLLGPHEFQVKSTHSQQLECFYNPILTTENSKFLKLIENRVVLSPNKVETINIQSGFIKEGIYSLNFKCYNLPGFLFKTETTGIMTKYSYYYEGGWLPDVIGDLIGELINDTTINCNEKKNSINPRCLKENIISIIDQMKTEIPKEISEIQEKVEHYVALAKDAKIEILNKLVEEFEKNKDTSIKTLVEKIIEILKYLTYTDCSIYASGSTNIESETIKGKVYLECRRKKQDILEKLLNKLKDILQCPMVINLITSNQISNNLEDNIKYILLLINELSNNPESFKEKTSEIIISLAECIDEKFDQYWPIIQEYLKNTKQYLNESIIAVKRDAINIILKTLENLAKVIDFEEIDGYISDAEKKITDTGLILYDKAKIIQKKILEFAKRLNEFGTANYTFSGSMLANIELKEDFSISADADIKATFVGDKDIVIITNSSLLFTKDNVYALQTLVFESPIVSVKANAEEKGSSDALSTFISITLYDKNGKEISINNIKEKLKPEILYLKEKYSKLNTCFYYDESKNDLLTKGISDIEKVNFMGKEYFKCVSSHLTSFTAGTSYNKKNKKSNTAAIVLTILSIILILAIGVGTYFYIRKRKLNLNDSIEKDFSKKEGLVSI